MLKTKTSVDSISLLSPTWPRFFNLLNGYKNSHRRAFVRTKTGTVIVPCKIDGKKWFYVKVLSCKQQNQTLVNLN